MVKATHLRNIKRLKNTAIKSADAIRKGQESTAASIQVVRKRVALGIDALANPLAADHREFGKMVPEKISAITSTGLILGERSAQLGCQFVRHATDEMARAASHARAMMTMTNPLSALTAQTAYLMGAAERGLNFSLLLSNMGASLVNAAGSPSHRAVMTNAGRLA